MSFRIGWHFPARKALLDIRSLTRAAAVDAAVQRFAVERAPLLESGAHDIREASYKIRVFVDRKASTVLVLWLARI